MKRKPDLRERALKAHRLARKNIIGEELAARLKTDPDTARNLVTIGRAIERAERQRLSHVEHERCKVIARVMARKFMMGICYAKPSEVDFAAGKRAGWCGKALVSLVARGVIEMPLPGHIVFTNIGWALVWEAGLIKPNWKVPA